MKADDEKDETDDAPVAAYTCIQPHNENFKIILVYFRTIAFVVDDFAGSYHTIYCL